MERDQSLEAPVCGCGKPWPQAAIMMGAQCINCGESSPPPPPRPERKPKPTERELALEGALIDLADLHHRTLKGSRKHDPRSRDFWDCDCLSCMAAMRAIGADSPLFKIWQAKAKEQRECP